MSEHDSTHFQDTPATGVVEDPWVLAARQRLAAAERDATTGPTSLAYTGRMVTAVRPLSCPKARDRVVVELHSGSVFPDRCGTNGCLFCLPLNARRRALAITLVQPQRMIRLSLAADKGDDNPCRTALIRIKRIRQALKRMHIDPGEWSYTLERNPNETGFHVHCLQTGSFLPQDDLQTACKRAKAGFPYINAIKRTGQWTSRYSLKGFGADGYGLKKFRPNGDAADALKINNNYLEHHTTRFFTLDGETLTVKKMESLAIGALNADQPKAFIGMSPSSVDRVLADHGLRHALILDLKKRSAAQLRALN